MRLGKSLISSSLHSYGWAKHKKKSSKEFDFNLNYWHFPALSVIIDMKMLVLDILALWIICSATASFLVDFAIRIPCFISVCTNLTQKMKLFLNIFKQNVLYFASWIWFIGTVRNANTGSRITFRFTNTTSTTMNSGTRINC